MLQISVKTYCIDIIIAKSRSQNNLKIFFFVRDISISFAIKSSCNLKELQ